MFRNDLLENKTNRITIDDTDAEVVEEMLEYIYTDTKVSQHLAADLFIVSNKYALLGLQEMCESILIENMEIATVADILFLAESHTSERLKKATVQFIIENIKAVTQTASWKRLRETDRDLCIDVLEEALQQR
ncbi:speckle-type POZ protein-like [Musca autumnalis]|uniref:speckle-type POZ protein-like n=1 Tax=Musca autumnalis TaxID=221902 RepID=UPI003CF489F3